MDCDFFVIGAGSGGVRASRMAAAAGARVVVAEAGPLGGTCVNVGCIPKKLLSYAAHYAEDFADAAGFGWTVGERRFDWPTLIANKDREIARLGGIYERLLVESGVEIVRGRARLTAPGEVEVAGRRFRAQHILVATGGRALRPDVVGADLTLVSDDVFHLDRQPGRVVIAGSGYIAVEFASIFHGLGSEVTLVHRRTRLLRGFDHEAAEVLALEMAKKGVLFRPQETIERIDRAASGLAVSLGSGAVLEADAVLYAIGRAPATAGLGLAEVGVELDPSGAVVVDALSRASVAGVYAIGDVTDRINLTPVAIHEAMCLVRTLFGDAPTRVDHEMVPSAVFSHPNLAAVGLTEEAARERRGEIRVFRSRFRPLRHTLTARDETMLVKLVVDARSDRVLGAHVVGADAGEIVQGFAVALKMGATKAQLDATIGIHPTAAEELVTLR